MFPVATVVAAIASMAVATSVGAQTDYYNTSAGRPLRVEDAITVEYRGVELDLAPFRLERVRGGLYHWSLHPEVAIGLFPRTQLQLAVPIAYLDAGSLGYKRGVAGVELSAMHTLNAETTIPAIAIATDVLLPVGPLGGDHVYATVKGLVTRTLPWARLHANAEVTTGPGLRDDVDDDTPHVPGPDGSRWLVGLAIDRTFPLRSLLIAGEVFAEQPLRREEAVAWSAGTGLRYQMTPRWAVDGGIGRRLTGDDRAWYVTFGSAFAIGLP